MNAGSNLEFTVTNTTSVTLVLSNTPHGSRSAEQDVHSPDEHTLVLTPVQRRFERVGPVDLFVALNGTRLAFHKRASEASLLATGLDLNNVHDVRITFPISKDLATVQVSGIVVDGGGLLLSRSTTTSQILQSQEKSGMNGMNYPPLSTNDGKTKRTLIEIVAPASILTGLCLQDKDRQHCSVSAYWPQLMENYFASTSLSLLPVPPSTCATRQCQSRQEPASTMTALAQDIFFRAGAPGTHLYDRLWPFGSARDTPAALVLMLGLADVEAFLGTRPTTKHQITQFTDEFARTYSNFIQTIRRTAYSPASMAKRQRPEKFALQDDIDESYLYNSSPSSIPIFLVLQPIPTALIHLQSRQLKSLLHHATLKVLNELKWHIGDRHTFVVDAEEWLSDSDFVHPPSDEKHHVESSLTQSGHIKFAHHMSLHLCHYVLGWNASTSECPFDRHDDYAGNLYVPEAAGVGKLIEEKKTARVKEIFGVE